MMTDNKDHTGKNTQEETQQSAECSNLNSARIDDQPINEESTSHYQMKILDNEECNKDVGPLSSQVSSEEKNKKYCHWKYVLAFFILIAVIAFPVVGKFLGTALESGKGKIQIISKL